MSSRPVRVLLVARDGTLLSQLSRLLSLLHYEAEPVQPEQALTALGAATFDVLLIDSCDARETMWELCRAAQHLQSGEPLLTLLMIDRPEPSLVAEAIEAGVDDFLTRPIIVGELLVRLRAAARAGEFERRYRSRARRDAITGLRTRRGLLAALRRRAVSSATALALEIDFPDAVSRQWGRPATVAAVHGVAEALRTVCDESSLLGHFGSGRFGIIRLDRSLAETRAWMEELRPRLAALKLPDDRAMPGLTFSVGMAAAPHDAPPDEPLLDKAEEALSLARRTGRNRVATAAELQREAEAWAEWAKPGSLFERTCARDVMVACPTVLAHDEPMAGVVRRGLLSGGYPLPVAGDDGRLVGALMPEEHLVPTGHSGTLDVRVADRMTRDVPAFDADATLAELTAFFRDDDRALAGITSDGRPLGWVTPALLAGLHAPLTTESFASDDSAAGLTVPDSALCALAGV